MRIAVIKKKPTHQAASAISSQIHQRSRQRVLSADIESSFSCGDFAVRGSARSLNGQRVILARRT
jgi:hypothetical protein